jgi:hypothetical protein
MIQTDKSVETYYCKEVLWTTSSGEWKSRNTVSVGEPADGSLITYQFYASDRLLKAKTTIYIT